MTPAPGGVVVEVVELGTVVVVVVPAPGGVVSVVVVDDEGSVVVVVVVGLLIVVEEPTSVPAVLSAPADGTLAATIATATAPPAMARRSRIHGTKRL